VQQPVTDGILPPGIPGFSEGLGGLSIDDAACLPLWFGQNYILVKPYVEGYELTPMGYTNLNKVIIRAE